MSRRPDHARASTREPIERWLIVLAGVSLWSILPPYLGPVVGLKLDVDASVDVVDTRSPGRRPSPGRWSRLRRRGAE